MKQPDWKAIRRFYSSNLDCIMRAGPSDWGVDPYSWDFELGVEMTAIEDAIWCEIRNVGCVMYPQFPVGRRFVDFGNPCVKVAIECDGADFHGDPDADMAREQEIEALGWRIYRISGSDCMRITRVRECKETGVASIIPSPGHKLVRLIADRYGIRCAPTRAVGGVSVLEMVRSAIARQ